MLSRTMQCRVRVALLAAVTSISARFARADEPVPNANPRSWPSGASVPGSLVPDRLPYVAGQLPPSGYHVEERTRPWLPVAGGFLFGAFYALAAGSEVFSVSAQCSTDRWLFLPIAGPFVAASYRGNDAKAGCQNAPDSIPTAGYFIADGLGQTVGAAFLIAAVAAPKTELVRDPGPSPKSARLDWRIVPAIGRSQSGLNLIATF